MSAREQWIDPRLADQLDQELELIRTGASPEPIGRGFSTAYAAVAVHALDDRDVEPDPSAGYVRVLGEHLMKSASTVTLGTDRPLKRVSTVRHSDGIDIPKWISEVVSLRAAAAFVLLVVTTLAVAGLRGQGDGEDNRPRLQAASQPEATALPTVSSVPLIEDAVDTAECNATARPPGTIEGLVGTAPSTSDVLPRQPPPDQDRVIELSRSDFESLAAGLPTASQEETDGVLETVRQLSACRLTVFNPYNVSSASPPFGPYEEFEGRFFGLFSDDYFRRIEIPIDTVADPAVMVLPWFPVGPFPLVIEDLRRLEDGRLLALVQPEERARWSLSVGSVIVFARSGGHWLVDERIDTTPGSGDIDSQVEPATPAPGEHWPQFLEVSLGDEGGSYWQVPTSAGSFRENVDVLVSVGNNGSVPYQFEIPELDVQISIPAGHSVSFVLHASAGSYDYRAMPGQPGDVDMQRMEGTLVFVPEGEPIPMG